MKTNCHNLPGICEVRYIHVTDLQPYLVERADAGAPIAVEINKSQVIYMATPLALPRVRKPIMEGKRLRHSSL